MGEVSDALIKTIILFIIPPIAVYMEQNATRTDVIINFVLSLFFMLPGILHGVFILILRGRESGEEKRDQYRHAGDLDEREKREVYRDPQDAV